MERIWLKSYPDGVPADVDLNQLRTLAQLIDESCARNADSVAYVQMGRSLTYRDLDRLARNFAAYLQKTTGLAKGERFAIMLPNVLQYPIAMFAALRSGLIVVNTNPLYTAPELEHQLADSGATA
ncbi:MAG: long-chain acyl-CoA synthetase, partial [Gammaproteobacteria bacterium]|nr:long-chain acyl-CoA synthetase [Gammaproteobacteria bacterium]